VLNAAAALFVAAKAASIMDAIPLAEQAIDSGAAKASWRSWWSSPPLAH